MPHLIARLVLAAGLGCAATAALAQANIAECEKISAADAYNQCLAKFGPTSKVKSLEPERPGDVKATSEEAAAGASKGSGGHGAKRGGHRRGHAARRSSGGRKRMTISVGRHRRHR